VFVVSVAFFGSLLGPALDGFFILDDFAWLDCALDSTSDLSHIFTFHISNFFRPFAHLVWMLVFLCFGPNAAAFHCFQVLLNALAVTLLAHLAWRLFDNRWLALLSALCFVLNPSYSEAVIWISGVSEPIHAVLVLLTLLAFHRYLTTTVTMPIRRWCYIASLVGFVLAHGAKESAVALLPLMVLLHLATALLRRVPRRSPFSTFRIYLPFALMELAYLAAQYMLQQQSYLVKDGIYDVGLHAIVVLGASTWHLLLLTWPPFAVGALNAALHLRRTETETARRAFQGGLILLGAVVVSIVPYSMFRVDVLASRYFYLPSMVVALAAAVTLHRLLARAGERAMLRSALGYLGLAALAGLAVLTMLKFDAAVHRYLHAARQTAAFVTGATQLPTDRPPVLIFQGLLQGQHLRGAMRAFHPAGPRVDFRSVTRDELRSRPEGTVWHYLGDGQFEKIDLD
jgi:hypothetical protein